MTFPIGTRVREISTGDLGTVVEPERNVDPTTAPIRADATWVRWDGEKYAHQPVMWLPASEVEAAGEEKAK